MTAILQINVKGQCPECRVKPIVYKRDKFKFCCRCHRAYSLDTGEQIANWAFEKSASGEFQPKRSI